METEVNQENTEEPSTNTKQVNNKIYKKLKSQSKARVIIRNLVYDVNKNHIISLVSKYGKVDDINIPINKSTNKSKGFAFIQFQNKNQALKAIKELNGTQFKGRKILIDLACPKNEFEEYKKKKQFLNNNEASAQDDQGEYTEKSNEINKENELSEEDNNNKDFEKSEEELGEEKEQDGEEEEESNNREMEGEKTEEKDQTPENFEKKKKKTPENLDFTIFVRNISYTTTEEDFKEFFEQFGELHFAKLVINKSTMEHKGTGFVKFADSKIAQHLIKQSQEQEHNYSNKISDVDFELDGRRLILLQALHNEDITKLQTQNKDKGPIIPLQKCKSLDDIINQDKNQRRNSKLSLLGIFSPQEFQSQSKQQTAQIHLQNKIEKLKNPNFIVSQTRVMVKFLPKRNFFEQDLRNFVEKVLNKVLEKNVIKKQRIIKQVKILQDKNQKEEGEFLKTTGIGFVEFVSHDFAHAFVLYAQNNKNQIKDQLGGILPIIEFGIEDIRFLKKREKIITAMKEKSNQVQMQNQDSKKQENITEKKQKQIQAKSIILRMIEEKSNNQQELQKQLEQINSRGMKQRLLKRISSELNIQLGMKKEKQLKKVPKKSCLKQSQNPYETMGNDKKINEKQGQKQKFSSFNKIQNHQSKLDVETQQIKQNIKKKKLIRKQKENKDNLDDIIEDHLKKHQKKLRWNQ